MIFEGYLDESVTGTGDSRVFTLSCLIAPVSRWRAFSKAWASAMARGGAAGKVLHMTDLANGAGDFRGWTNDEKNGLLKRLLPLVTSFVSYGLAGSIPVPTSTSLREVLNLPDANPGDGVTAYSLALQGTLEAVVDRVKPSQANPVEFFMEVNQSVEADATRHLYHLTNMRDGWGDLFLSMTSSPKGPPPLQAADLVAYEWSRFVSEQLLQRGKRPPRRTFLELDRSRKFEFAYANDAIMGGFKADLARAYVEAASDPKSVREINKSFKAADARMQKERSRTGRKKSQ